MQSLPPLDQAQNGSAWMLMDTKSSTYTGPHERDSKHLNFHHTLTGDKITTVLRRIAWFHEQTLTI